MSLRETIRQRQTEPAPDPAPGPPEQVEPPDAEPGPDGITRRLMDSKVLGTIVPFAWTPDGGTVWVDGIPYTAQEVGELKRRNVDAATMRAVHETKRAFDATLN